MPMPVTAKQRRIYEFIRRYIDSNQEPPTIAEIGRQFQMSSSASVHGILSALEREGLIKRIPNVSRGIEVMERTVDNDGNDIPLLGINRFVVAADTDREAMELGRRAWPSFYASFMKLWKKHGTQPRYARIPEDFDTLVKHDGALAGSPGTIAEYVHKVAGGAGANYFISQFSFGDLSQQEVLHSAAIFADEVLAESRERVVRAV